MFLLLGSRCSGNVDCVTYGEEMVIFDAKHVSVLWLYVCIHVTDS